MVIRLPALTQFGSELTELGWVSDLLIAGSLATGDYVPAVSDLDLVIGKPGCARSEGGGRRSRFAAQ